MESHKEQSGNQIATTSLPIVYTWLEESTIVLLPTSSTPDSPKLTGVLSMATPDPPAFIVLPSTAKGYWIGS